MDYHGSLSRRTRCYTIWQLEVCRDRIREVGLRKSEFRMIQDDLEAVEYEILRLRASGTLRLLSVQEAVRVEELEEVLRAVLPAYASERTRLLSLSRESTSGYGELLGKSLMSCVSSDWGSMRQQARAQFVSEDLGRGGERWVGPELSGRNWWRGLEMGRGTE